MDIVQHQIARRYDRNQGLGGSPLAGTDWVTSSEECEQTLAELERQRLARPAVRADELSGERAGPRRLHARRLTANFHEPHVREPVRIVGVRSGGPR